ncbi:MAG: hypothetical protein WC482_05230, partial [Candidatus Omnitrophota bacterium]
MTVTYLRAFFIIVSTIVGYYIGAILGNFSMAWRIGGAILGLASSSLIVVLEGVMRRCSIRNLSAAVFGLVFGFFMAWILTSVLKL